MSEFAKGDYVVLTALNGDGDCGRVASVSDSGMVFVCFTTGCTAAACNPIHIERVMPSTGMLAIPFGHHRFDAECPDYDLMCCRAYCPEKGGE